MEFSLRYLVDKVNVNQHNEDLFNARHYSYVGTRMSNRKKVEKRRWKIIYTKLHREKYTVMGYNSQFTLMRLNMGIPTLSMTRLFHSAHIMTEHKNFSYLNNHMARRVDDVWW